MKATILISAVIGATFAWAAPASAEDYASKTAVVHYPHYAPHSYYHASTYEEGVLRGWAEVRRALGEYNYNTSLALINREAARSRYLDNKEKYVETYFTRKKINKEYRDSLRKPRPTREDYARWSRQRAPQRLSASQYDPLERRLYWPSAFTAEEFAAERKAVDQLIAARSANGEATTASQLEMPGLIDKMKSKLKKRLATLTPTQYVAAKNFLSGVAYEAQSPVDVRSLAVR